LAVQFFFYRIYPEYDGSLFILFLEPVSAPLWNKLKRQSDEILEAFDEVLV
jgi:hypothetical protein